MTRDRRLSLFFYDLATIGLAGLVITTMSAISGGGFHWRIVAAPLAYAAAYLLAGWRLGLTPRAYLRSLRKPMWPPASR